MQNLNYKNHKQAYKPKHTWTKK